MRNRLLIFSSIILLFISCDKKYEIFGEIDSINNYQSGQKCIIEEIPLSNYFKASAYVIEFEFDNQGVMWVGTNQGLLKIDSNEFSIYNTSNTILEDNSINSLNIDNESNIWMSTYYGLYMYNQNNDSWKVFNSQTSSFYYNTGRVFVDDNSKIFVASNSSIYQYDGSDWVSYINTFSLTGTNLYSYQNKSIIGTQGNIMWVGSDKGLLKYENDTTWELFNTANSGITDNRIFKLSIDQLGRKWLLTESGVEMFDDSTWYLFDDKNHFEVEDGLIIARSSRYSYLFFSYQNNEWNPFLNQYYDCPDYFHNARYDSQNYLWISDNSKIYKIIKF